MHFTTYTNICFFWELKYQLKKTPKIPTTINGCYFHAVTRNGALREEKCKHQVVCVRKGCSFKTKMKFLCVSGLSWHSAPAVRDYTFVIERDVLTPFPFQKGSCPPSDFHHTSSQTSCLVVLQSEKLQFHIFGAVEYGRLKIRPSFMLPCQQCSSAAYTGLANELVCSFILKICYTE